MARVLLSITTEGEIALVAATAKTILQAIAASNHRVACIGWGVSFDGVLSTAEPVQVFLQKQTSAGTATSATPVKKGDFGETIQTTASKNASAEPTSTDIYRRIEVHPQGGSWSEYFPPGQEIPIPGGGRIGIVCTAPAAVNASAWIDVEE